MHLLSKTTGEHRTQRSTWPQGTRQHPVAPGDHAEPPSSQVPIPHSSCNKSHEHLAQNSTAFLRTVPKVWSLTTNSLGRNRGVTGLAPPGGSRADLSLPGQLRPCAGGPSSTITASSFRSSPGHMLVLWSAQLPGQLRWGRGGRPVSRRGLSPRAPGQQERGCTGRTEMWKRRHPGRPPAQDSGHSTEDWAVHSCHRHGDLVSQDGSKPGLFPAACSRGLVRVGPPVPLRRDEDVPCTCWVHVSRAVLSTVETCAGSGLQ